MTEAEMRQIASWIAEALSNPDDEPRLDRIAGEVRTLSAKLPIPGFDSLPWSAPQRLPTMHKQKRAALASGPSVNCEL